jgi:hypothetical protein
MTGETTHGWRSTLAGGHAGYAFALQAALANDALGAQVSEQVRYPNTRVDDQEEPFKGEPFSGAHRYGLPCPPDQLPLVAVLWNMTLYGDAMFLVANDMHRYNIGNTTNGLKKHQDGSITISIQP